MNISIFLSYPKPCSKPQRGFIERVRAYLNERGFAPRALGVTDYDVDEPLRAIRRLMRESNGIVTVAFRRTFIKKGAAHYRTDIKELEEIPLDGKWLTTPWAHIEPAMAYQLGLPILIFRENGVFADGILEKGVVGLYMPEFDLSKNIGRYLASAEWSEVMGKWEGLVRAVVDKKGNPPELF